tara:strand:- start:2004 stop:2471 length:468 start_codon:yes stop_codon:yes gene_type:complete
LNINFNHKKERNFFNKLKKISSKKLDHHIHNLHNEVFDKTSCIECANCCKTTSPIFNNNDIQRIAKNLKIKFSDFIDKYLTIDSDNDMVLKSSPCVFLSNENKCEIYDFRPKACKEYPHTDRKKQNQILDLSRKNTLVCPAVAEIFEKLKIKLNY